VRPWTSLASQGVVSCGHRELDDLLGGGHVLGSVMLLLEDTYSDYAMTLLRYEIAEALSMNHRVIVLDADNDDRCNSSANCHRHILEVLRSLPFNLNVPADEIEKSFSGSEAIPAVQPDTSSPNDLKIAWQYGKYMNSSSKSKQLV